MAKDLSLKKEEIFKKITKILNGMLQTSQQDGLRKLPGMRLNTDIINDLGIDSVEVMDLMGLLEKEFNITIEPDQVAGKRIISEIVDYIAGILRGT